MSKALLEKALYFRFRCRRVQFNLKNHLAQIQSALNLTGASVHFVQHLRQLLYYPSSFSISPFTKLINVFI